MGSGLGPAHGAAAQGGADHHGQDTDLDGAAHHRARWLEEGAWGALPVDARPLRWGVAEAGRGAGEGGGDLDADAQGALGMRDLVILMGMAQLALWTRVLEILLP
eukprot:11181027-Alexandrium_andersonii.AAC.1